MRDAFPKFEANDLKLYAVSYDDKETLREFSDKQNVPYPLLSDENSRIIKEYGILNTEVAVDDFLLYGIPFPGVYVCDEQGVVIAKFFHDTYKKRDSAEIFIDAALGKIQIADDAPQAKGGDGEIKVTAAIHGGKGSIRQGIIRKLVVRFEMNPGLHIYSEPVPEGMIATSIKLLGPPGLVVQEPILPATEVLHLQALGVDLNVWSGTVDLVVPFYAAGELISETRPLDQDEMEIEVQLRYQACNDSECLLPKTENFKLKLDMDVIDVPKIGMHLGHGQRAGNYDGRPAMKRLLWRKFKANPLSLFKFIAKSIRLELQARKRAKTSVK